MDSLASTFISGNSPPAHSVKRTEVIDSEDSLSQLPDELFFNIFGYLSARELARSGQVNRKWQRIAFNPFLWNALDLTRNFHSLKVFDASDWAKYIDLLSYGLTTEDELPLDNCTVIPFLARYLPSLSIEEKAGFTLLTIPKNLTFNKLVKLSLLPKKGNITQFRRIGSGVSKEIGDIPVDETYRVLITNNILEGTRRLSIIAQKNHVEKLGCERPRALEAAALLVTTFMSSKQRLYNDDPFTYTHCEDQVGEYQLVVGGFTTGGLFVDHFYNFKDKLLGIGGVLRKF